MSFFEVEFPRAIEFDRTGGEAFNTAVNPVQSGQEQRNAVWSAARFEYSGGIVTPGTAIGNTQQFIDRVRTFFLLTSGMKDGFRYYDAIYNKAIAQSCLQLTTTTYQMQVTHTLGGRSYVRTITKPITSAVIDYTGSAVPALTVAPFLGNYFNVYIGGVLQTSGYTVDYTTGIITFSVAPGSAVTADFQFHIPVRLTSDKFEPTVPRSGVRIGNPIIHWKSLGLIEVRPPNY